MSESECLPSAAPIYARLADELCLLIGNGQLRPGERLPSVRRLSRQKQVSATTAIAALRSLETRGLVEARPQSGYFVRSRGAPTEEPAMTRPSGAARIVGVDNLMVRMIDAALNPNIAPLGTAAEIRATSSGVRATRNAPRFSSNRFL